MILLRLVLWHFLTLLDHGTCNASVQSAGRIVLLHDTLEILSWITQLTLWDSMAEAKASRCLCHSRASPFALWNDGGQCGARLANALG